MPQGVWEFWLADSNDLSRIMPLTLGKDRKLSLKLNRPGSFNFSYPINDPNVDRILPVETCVIAYRNGVAKWSGPVWTTQETYPENKMAIGCVGWFEILNHRLLALDVPSLGDVEINNPGFEVNIAGWTIVNNGNIFRNTLSAHVRTGVGSLNASTDSVGNCSFKGSTIVFSGVQFHPNYSYTVSFWAKNLPPSAINISANSIFGGPVNISPPDYVRMNSIPVTSTYTQYFFPPWIPQNIWNLTDTNGISIFMEISGGPSEIAFFDDFLLTAKYIGGNQIFFNNFDAGLIAHNLLTEVNKTNSSKITVGTRNDVIKRTRNYKKFENLGRIIQELSDVESGFDWEIDPLTRAFNIKSFKGLSKIEAVFGYEFGPNNILSITRNLDASVLANIVYATGKSSFAFGRGFEIESIQKYNVLEDIISLTGVSDINMLTAMANVETILRNLPRQILEIVPKPNAFPFPFDDYDLGDTVFLTMNRPFKAVSPFLVGISLLNGSSQIQRTPLLMNQGVRVFGFDIDIDDNGNEKIGTLQVAP